MDPSEKTQHAIRRSTRLPLEVPVLVTSLNPSVPFSERCNTTLVNAHGCGLIAVRALARGLQVRLEIVSAKRHTTATVGEVVSLGSDPRVGWLGWNSMCPATSGESSTRPRIGRSKRARRRPRSGSQIKSRAQRPNARRAGASLTSAPAPATSRRLRPSPRVLPCC